MNTNINFKDLWQKQMTSQPDMKDLRLKLRHFRNSNLKKMIILDVLLAATCVFIIFIWIYYQPQMITTKIGIVLTILAIVMYLFTSNKLYTVYNKIDHNQTNQEYLQNLILLKTKQKYLQTTILSWYYLLLSIGICLYMIEYTSRMTSFWQVFSYTILIIWIGFNWLYTRPRTIKKQNIKLDELINKFGGMNAQSKEM